MNTTLHHHTTHNHLRLYGAISWNGFGAKKVKTRLSLKCSAWKGIMNFGLKYIFKRNFRSEKKNFGRKKNLFWKKVLSEKILVRKNFGPKKFWTEKILVQKYFWNQQNFWSKILGPKKFWICKKFFEKNKFKAKINFGLGKFFRKKLWVQFFFF